jgi:hypothetical protein
MPCIFISSQSFENPIIPGDTTIGSGTGNQRDMPWSQYYYYSYSGVLLKPSQLSAIPNGAKITRIEYQYEVLTNGTYGVENVDSYMFQTPSTFNGFPSNTRINGYSNGDDAWNNSITNYFQTEYDTIIPLVKISSDPNIMWRGLTLTNPYENFDNTKNLIIIFNCKDGYYSPGSQTYPRVKGLTTTNTGTCYFGRRDSDAYLLTDYVNKQLNFFPNMRIYWE